MCAKSASESISQHKSLMILPMLELNDSEYDYQIIMSLMLVFSDGTRLFIFCDFYYCCMFVCGGGRVFIQVPQCMCRRQRTTFGSWFSSPTVWVLVVEDCLPSAVAVDLASLLPITYMSVPEMT